MPTLTEAHLRIVHNNDYPELKKLLLTNDTMYANIKKGITEAYGKEGISLPEDPLDIVVGIVSENPPPGDYGNLETYYHDKAKYGMLSGGGRKRRKSKKRKSKKRRTKKRKSKKRNSKKRNNLKSNI